MGPPFQKGTEMFQPFDVPRSFVEELQDYDPLLRVKWDKKYDYWRIERKLPGGRRWGKPNDASSPQDLEAYNEGFLVVLRVPVDALDQRVFWALYHGDIKRRGGFEKVSRQMNEWETEKQEKMHAEALDEAEQRSKARWDSWNTNYPKTKYGRKDYLGGF